MDPFAEPRRKELDTVIVPFDVIEPSAAEPVLPVAGAVRVTFVPLAILLRRQVACGRREPRLDGLETAAPSRA